MDPALRSVVLERAGFRCKYCPLHGDHQPAVPFHVQHIIARQHGGNDSPANLALACRRCNLCKGPNLTGLDPDTGELTRLFHPRQDHWNGHFAFKGGDIIGLTAVGRTTAALLQMNAPERIQLRRALLASGLWHSIQARP
jgi:hypothetical protein